MTSAKWVGFIFLGLACALHAPASVAGNEIIVTRMDDPVPNGCAPTDCSLREAVIAANVAPANYDVIRLAAGTYVVNNTPLAITGGTDIQGAGNTLTLIRGNGSTDVMTFAGEHQLDLANLAIDAQGERELVAVNANRVGLYRVRAPNPLGRIEVRAPDNNAPDRGDFWVGDSEISAAIICVDKSDCRAFGSDIARLSVSGTIDFGVNNTVVSLSDVIVDGALAPNQASGVSISTGDMVTLSHVTVQDTRDGLRLSATPLSFGGEFAVDRLRYLGNAAPMVIGNMEGQVTRSEFLDNTNSDLEEPLPGAVSIGATSLVEITGSTFTGNRGSSTAGGAILVEGSQASLSMRNSTFSGNSISVAAAALPGGARGGAIGYRQDSGDDVSVILRHITVSAPSTAPVGLTGSAIGGFGAAADGTLRVYNSILRGSCSFAAGSIDFGIGNIESGGDTCGLPTPANQVGVSSTALALGTLANHGGYTPTYLPAVTSVAIDSANAAFCVVDDQRGYARPLGAGCDVGAVEAGDVIFADGYD